MEVMNIKLTACIIGTANEGTTMYDDPALIERFAYLDIRRNDDFNPAIWIPKIRKHYLAKALRAYMDGGRYHVIPERRKRGRMNGGLTGFITCGRNGARPAHP